MVPFLVDTGADTSLLMPDDYQQAIGLDYKQVLSYPLSPSQGFGGSLIARLVPATLLLFDAAGELHRIPFKLELARSSSTMLGLPSVIGRDVLDLFHLTVDRSIGLVSLTDAQGDMTSEFWPDGEPRNADS